MTLVYFAWVRERIGKRFEQRDLPADVRTVGELMDWLKGQGAGYAAAFADDSVIQAALDYVHAPKDASLENVREVAFFPPVSGG
ncbi:MAG: molybdopterin converting factor subunit 1 [Methylobacteriaceae bacterium]|nr:molybdopterin converting factor subunit 1 [Methylobacteriaceae bacterium]